MAGFPRHLAALARTHRRATVAATIAGALVCVFGAGAFAMRGDGGGGTVEVETVGRPEPDVPKSSTTKSTTKTTTTTAPATTTTAAPTTTPATEATPETDPPSPAPAPVATYTFEAPGAGTITVTYANGVLNVVATQAYAGWVAQVHTATGTEYVKVTFRNGNVVKWVKARVRDGEVVAETGEWTECETAPDPVTATYEHPGVGSITVTWNGHAFSLDAVTPASGWAVSHQEVTSDFVKVFFAPTSSTSAMTGDGGSRWIKVKIHDCRIEHLNG